MFAIPLLLLALTVSPAQAFSSKKANDTVWVSRADGSKQCEKGSGQSLETGADELRKAGVEPLESRKGRDGKMHSQMCGASTGATNEYRVTRDAAERAAGLGFTQLAPPDEK